MKILSYSPSCAAYAEVMVDGAPRYYDLSRDIVSMQVGRVSDGSSNFDLVLQNKAWKYNGVFTPMDKIVLYATKEGTPVKLFSGFITECDIFSLYQKDFHLRGKCTLYKIEKLYWDPAITASQQLLWETRNTNSNWAGFAQTIFDLLTKVGGWNSDAIAIADIPAAAEDFARQLYLDGKEGSDELKSMVDEFHNILQTHGASGPLSGGGTTTEEGTTSGNYKSGTLDGVNVTSIDTLPAKIREEVLQQNTRRQQAVAMAIQELGKPYVYSKVGPESYDCSGLACYCMTGKHKRVFRCIDVMKMPEVSTPRPGDLCARYQHMPEGVRDRRHVMIYIGGGKTIHASTRKTNNVQWGTPDKGMTYHRYLE